MILDVTMSQPSWNACSLTAYNETLQPYLPFPGDALGLLPSGRAGGCSTGSKGGTRSACAASCSSCSTRPLWSHSAFPSPPPEPCESLCPARSSLKPFRWKLACKLNNCPNARQPPCLFSYREKQVTLSQKAASCALRSCSKATSPYRTHPIYTGYVLNSPFQANLGGKTRGSVGELSIRKHILPTAALKTL